jgi:hypothetical protein
MKSVRRAIVAFNDYDESELPELRHRITLITSVPALQGYSMVRYADWCSIIAEYVAARLGIEPQAHVPQVIANACLGAAMATYRHWIQNPEVDLVDELDQALWLLECGFSDHALQTFSQ